MRQFQSTRRRRAFTMPEVLLAMALLTAGLTSILLLFPAAARMQASAVHDTAGRAYAESVLAALRANANLMGTNAAMPALVDSPFNPAAMTAIPSTNSLLPGIASPTGNYQYRVCLWEPMVYDSKTLKYIASTGHFNAAVFAFIPSYGPDEALVGTSPTMNVSIASLADLDRNGLTILTVTGLPQTFSADQAVLIQDITPTQATPPTASQVPTAVTRVVNVSGNKVTVSPALPWPTTAADPITSHQFLMVYLPQGAVAVATGSLR